MSDDDLTEALSLRITKSDAALLEELAGRLPMKKLSIARVAMRIGLETLHVEPARALTRDFTRETFEETKRHYEFLAARLQSPAFIRGRGNQVYLPYSDFADLMEPIRKVRKLARSVNERDVEILGRDLGNALGVLNAQHGLKAGDAAQAAIATVERVMRELREALAMWAELAGQRL